MSIDKYLRLMDVESRIEDTKNWLNAKANQRPDKVEEEQSQLKKLNVEFLEVESFSDPVFN